jgi:hypothetical protein
MIELDGFVSVISSSGMKRAGSGMTGKGKHSVRVKLRSAGLNIK